MHQQKVITQINNLLPEHLQLSEAEKQSIQNVLVLKHFPKKAFLLEKGSVSKGDYFIVKGAVKMYFIDKDGKENIIFIGVEDSWMGDLSGYFESVKSNFYIQALEDTTTLHITYADIENASKNSEALSYFNRRIINRSYNTIVKRILNLSTLTAAERFESFMKTSSHLINRIPNYILASYIGMSAEYFSKNLSKWHKQ